jgi:hypothetical protein
MGSQFFHFEAYAREGTKGKRNAAMILDEASRVLGACPHVTQPVEPRVLDGVAPELISGVIQKRIKGAVDRRGRSLPRTSLVLVAAVASYPVQRHLIVSDDKKRAAFERWKTLNFAFFRNLFGDALVSVIEHVDEEYPHLHVFCVPNKDENSLFSVESILAPFRAQGEACRIGEGRKVQRNAFRAEARKLQDEYHKMVGLPCGLTRCGPRRKRLTRTEWREQNEQAAAIATAYETIEKRQLALDREAQEMSRVQVTEAQNFAKAEVTRIRAQTVKYATEEILTVQAKTKSLLDKARTGVLDQHKRALDAEARLEAAQEEMARLKELLIENGVNVDHIESTTFNNSN